MEAAAFPAPVAHDDHHHGPPPANRSSRVEPEVLGILRRLPDHRYQELRHLWGDLSEMPIDHDDASQP